VNCARLINISNIFGDINFDEMQQAAYLRNVMARNTRQRYSNAALLKADLLTYKRARLESLAYPLVSRRGLCVCVCVCVWRTALSRVATSVTQIYEKIWLLGDQSSRRTNTVHRM
jgi:hypothetical protein